MSQNQFSADIKNVLDNYFKVVTNPRLSNEEYKNAHLAVNNILKKIFDPSTGGLTAVYYGEFMDTFASLAKNNKAFSLELMFYGIQFMTGDYDIIEGYTSIMSLISATYLPESRYTGTRFINVDKVLNNFVPVESRHYLTTYYRMD